MVFVFSMLGVLALFVFLDIICDIMKEISGHLKSISNYLGDFVAQPENINLPEDTITKLKEMSKSKLHETPTDQDSYLSGLKDGATMTAQFVLGELSEESS